MRANDLNLGAIQLGTHEPPAVIAEIGSNHDGSLDKALELMGAANQAGARAAKFQLFHPGDLYPPGTETHELLSRLALPREWLPDLMSAGSQLGIEVLASAFCSRCVSDLEDVGVPGHKLASSEVTNLGLVLRMARTGKPVLLSTGMSDLSDVARAVEVCRAVGNTNLVIMQCTSLYPTPPSETHLRAMTTMARSFGHHVGFSDHTLGATAAVTAVARGACLIEKHLTLDRSSPGPDHGYAAEPEDLELLCRQVADAHAMLGEEHKTFLEQERAATRRTGLYVATDVEAGDSLTRDVLDDRRPAIGITSEFIDAIEGVDVAVDVAEGAALRWEDLHQPRQGRTHD